MKYRMQKTVFISITVLVVLAMHNLHAFADDTFSLTLPKFNVRVNNQHIDNTHSQYPLLLYKGITYFPMTWNYAKALSLRTEWDPVAGFAISKISGKEATTIVSQDLGSANDYNGDYNVTLPTFKIKVNSKIVVLPIVKTFFQEG